jgi:hypothetical protein
MICSWCWSDDPEVRGKYLGETCQQRFHDGGVEFWLEVERLAKHPRPCPHPVGAMSCGYCGWMSWLPT